MTNKEPGQAGPLSGLRVVELAGLGPAPFAAMMLADMGARVIQIRRGGAFQMPGNASRDMLQRGKMSIEVDLKSDEGRETVLRLVESADVLIEGYRPGAAERLGLGPDECLARNPRLVYGRMTGWGQDGPWAMVAGHDPNYTGITGALHAIGRHGAQPQLPLPLVGDFGGGALYLVSGVLAALWEASRSGSGQVVDAAIVDGVSHLMMSPYSFFAEGNWIDERGSNLVDSGTPFIDTYETADGLYMVVAAMEEPFYREFVDRLGIAADMPAKRYDRSTWPRQREIIAAAFRSRTRAEWEEIFEGVDACVGPVLSMTEAPKHPHLVARGTFIDRGDYFEPAPAPRFSRTPSATPVPVDILEGEGAAQAVADWLA